MGVMDDRSSRAFAGVCLLVLLWIGTYWVYDPGRPATGAEVSFAEQPPDDAHVSPDTQPSPVPTPVVVATPPVSDPAPDRSLRVVPPEFDPYIVRSGDTFESIARQRWGDAALGIVIARANPLKDPMRLRVGELIRVPRDPTNIQGRVVDASGDPAEPTDRPAAQEPTAPAWAEYTVQPGDALTKIARAYYGSSRYADLIFEANRDRLSSPDALRVGQVLRMPPPPPGNPG